MLSIILHSFLFLFLVDQFTNCELVVSEYPKIEKANGDLRGRWGRSRNGRKFAAFEGVPYGVIPARFEASLLKPNWTGILDASTPGSMCPQFDPISKSYVDQTEDCLFVNVYVPMNDDATAAVEEKLAILFFIHGGGFFTGAGSVLGPHYYMDHNLILITINYRLGNLGFLNLGQEVPGNNGLKDLVLGLQWVQENIEHFNGDRNRVTIAGSSAGAVAVHALLLSPSKKVQGLFHAGISQSGSLFCPWAFQKTPQNNSIDFAVHLNCTGSSEPGNTTEIVECLKSKSVRELLEIELYLVIRGPLPSLVFVPSVDNLGDSKEGDYSVLPDTPENLLRLYKNNSAHLPYIVGHAGTEMIHDVENLLANHNLTKQLNENWDEKFPLIFHLQNFYQDPQKIEEVAQEFRHFYLNGGEMSEETFGKTVTLFSDFFFNHGIRKAGIWHAKRNAKVFPYVLNYIGETKLSNSTTEGVAHGDEMRYFFPSTTKPQEWPSLPRDSKDEEFSKNIVSTWASFVQSGRPKSWNEVDWPAISVESGAEKVSIGWLNLIENPAIVKEGKEEMDRYNVMEQLLTNGTVHRDHRDVNGLNSSSSLLLTNQIQILIMGSVFLHRLNQF